MAIDTNISQFDSIGICQAARRASWQVSRHVLRFGGGRWLSRAALSLTLAFGLSACGLSTQDKSASGDPLNIDNKASACMSDSLDSIESYFRGNAREGEIEKAFECVDTALETFSLYARGSRERNSYSTQELRTFLERYFLGDIRLNDAFLSEIMLIKQFLLGGESTQITRLELERARRMIGVLKTEAVRMRPYVRLLNRSLPDNGASWDPSLIEQGLSDFSFTMDQLGGLFAQAREPYKLANFATLLLEFQKLYRGRSNWTGPQWFAKQMPLITSAKALFIRPGGDQIAPDEWRSILATTGRLYGLFLRFKYLIVGRELLRGEGLSQIEISINEVADILEGAIDAKGTGVIDYGIIDEFIDAVYASEAFETTIRASTAKDLARPILEKILNPPRISARLQPLDPRDPRTARGARSPQNGLTKVNLARARSALLGWIENQQMWERVEREAVRENPALAGRGIPVNTVTRLWRSYKPIHAESWSDMLAVLEKEIPLSTAANGTMLWERDRAKISLDRTAFNGINWKQALVRNLGYGYVADPSRLRMDGILLSQFEELFRDMRWIAVDLGFLAPDDETIWNTGFQIANIFLFSSNGDDRLGFLEAVDLFVFSFGGSPISQRARTAVYQSCADRGPDSSGMQRVDEACWARNLRRTYAQTFAEMKDWVRHSRDFDEGWWQGFFHHLSRSSRKQPATGPMTSGEMDRAISIHHYIEAIFVRWDTNRDGRLSLVEADRAFYLFKPILKKASGFTDDEEVRALYMYLLSYGEPPDRSSISSIINWLWFKNNTDTWPDKVKAHRYRVLQIFGNLAESL
ncbi:MAG TPA: hypothetical protein PLZ57_01655 [Pseudobdellovibrionaceae bacterium]|nr:hypothetical protein [Pseudobdellovibrionaceae bacterium]